MTMCAGPVRAQETKLTANDAASDDRFGRSVSISGDYALVGAYRDDDAGSESGSAYVFVRSGTSWTQQAKLTASDAASNDNFGLSVSISGDYALVGAYRDDAAQVNAGSAYVFVRSGTSWTQQAKLTASDATLSDQFGISVSISGDYALVGANLDDDAGLSSGSAYVFVRSGTSWTQQAKLTASDGAPSDQFGQTVSISGDYALVGAHQDDDAGSNSGSAYVFVRSGTSWTQQTKLTAGDGASNDQFGISVSISGDYTLVGAHQDDDAGSNSGSAYVMTGSLLPVELVSFEALVDGTDVLLRWQTASETNNAGFEVQKRDGESANGEEGPWDVLAFVEGQGTTLEPQHYLYRVENQAPGQHVFQLKQIDFDGSFEYSPQVEVFVELPTAYLLTPPYPNPFNPEARFSLMVKRQQQVEVAVYDALGRQVRTLHQGEMDSEQARAFVFEASDLPSGLYLIRAVGEAFVATHKVMLIK